MADEDKKPEENMEENTDNSGENSEDNNQQTTIEEPVQIIIDDTHSKTVTPRTIEDEMEQSYLQYSMSVIVSRALPDVRDGLKPVHRRILYSMSQNGNRHNAKYRKSARIIGDVMGKYHPHGDSSIYDAMVRMAQEWSLRYMLVDGQGNFGSMDGDPPAAMRYTEARMMRMGEELLADIEKDTVPFRDNFDGTETEPEVLPARVPHILLNSQIGIAVGMATSIPSHNLSEVIDGTVALIDNPEITLDELMEHIKGPDFPTGGMIYGKNSIRAAYATGRGGVPMRGLAEVVEGEKNKHQIVVTEVPYGTSVASIITKIADLVKDKKIGGISDLRDESARGKVRMVVDLKKDAYPKKILNQLYKMTPLQSAFNFNMLALVDGIQPRVLGVEDMLKEWLKHRQIVIRRRTEFELKKARARAHVLEGLTIALDNIDEVIKTIRASETTEEAHANLMKKFKLSDIQAKAILAMQLRTLAGLERKKIEDELAELMTLIAKLEAILADEKKILKIIKEELAEIKARYGDARKTKIYSRELDGMSDEDLIPDEDIVVTMTAGNYIKRNLSSDYRKQNRGGKGKRGMITKEEDVIEQVVYATTHDMLLFFTNRGRVFRLKAYEVPQAGLAAKGVAAVNLLQMQPEETITSIRKLPKKTGPNDFLFMATKAGTVKKTPLSDYQNIRQSGLISIGLVDGDELKWIRVTNGDNEIVISTKLGQAIRFHESKVRPMGRNARGVRGIKLRPKDEVIAMDVVDEEASIFVISEKGFGKRTAIKQFTPHNRGGVGIKSAVVNAKTGNLVAVRSLVGTDQDLIIISKGGQIIRLGVKDISAMGRTTQGVRVMRLNGDDTVASVALAEKETVEEDDKNEKLVDVKPETKKEKAKPAKKK